MPTHFQIAEMGSLEELVMAARCKKRKRQEEARSLICEEADRRVKLQMVLEIADRCSRPAVTLAALKFAGPLSAAEIRHVLVSLPGRELCLADPDSDGAFVDLALDRLSELGYPIHLGKALRLDRSGAIREFVVYGLGEGTSDV